MNGGLDISDSFTGGNDPVISPQYLILALIVLAVLLVLYYINRESMVSVPIKIDDDKWSKVAAGMTLGPGN